MSVLHYDARLAAALSRLDRDPDGAAEALLIAAEYLRSGKQMPPALVEWLAGAFEASMAKPPAKRGAALLHDLGLRAENRRKAADWLEIGFHFDHLMRANPVQGEAAAQVAADFGISESTARRYWTQYVAAWEAHQAAT